MISMDRVIASNAQLDISAKPILLILLVSTARLVTTVLMALSSGSSFPVQRELSTIRQMGALLPIVSLLHPVITHKGQEI